MKQEWNLTMPDDGHDGQHYNNDVGGDGSIMLMMVGALSTR
jgi:hypothetical protein